jgi:predicted aspartyl protease
MLRLSLICGVLSILVAGSPGRADQTKARPERQIADELFKQGNFSESATHYTKAIAREPKSAHCLARLGYIALLRNRLDRAEELLKRAEKAGAEESPEVLKAIRSLLTEVYYRRDDFEHAAPLMRLTGREGVAKKLESFKGQVPYQLTAKGDMTSLKFVVTDPLPLVRLRVNGGEEANFLIDTGAPELMLDPAFAVRVGAKLFGAETGSFAGGKQAAVQQGRVDSVTMGDFTIRNVPIAALNTRQFAPIFGGKQVDGIVGTVLLKHFLSTLDYPNGQLILRRKSREAVRPLEAAVKAGKATAVPFWMAGDHFMVAWGKVNQAPPVLLFADTGLAGGGVTLAESVIKEAGISLDEDQAGTGIGGGGAVRIVPFTVAELGLGKITERDVRGLFTGRFPLEYHFGFRIGGIISHGFFRPYALTFDFEAMRLILQKP